MQEATFVKQYRLELLPLAVAWVIAATGVPVELRATAWWQSGFEYQDVANNLLLYAPLGIALNRRSVRTVLLSALLLSVAIEFTQLWSIGRFASPFDAAANATGAALAALAWRRSGLGDVIASHRGSIDGLWVGAAVTGIVAILATWALPVRSSGLADWNPEFPLQVGNEATGNRPWRGEIGRLALLPSALSPDSASVTDARAGAILDPGPWILRGGPAIVLPAAASRAFALAAVHENAFTVVADVAAENATQHGPARIVSFSIDPFDGNFDLGQDQGKIVFRVCTVSEHGKCERQRTETPPLLKAGTETWIVATYDGAVARIYVNGGLQGRRTLAAAGCRIVDLCSTAVPLAWALLGGLAAIVFLALTPWRNRMQVLAISALAGGCVLAAPRLLGIAELPLATQHWAQLMALFGAVAVAVAARLRNDTADRATVAGHAGE